MKFSWALIIANFADFSVSSIWYTESFFCWQLLLFRCTLDRLPPVNWSAYITFTITSFSWNRRNLIYSTLYRFLFKEFLFFVILQRRKKKLRSLKIAQSQYMCCMLKCSSQKRKIINSKFAADLFVKRPRVEKWIAESFKNSRFECKIDLLFFVELNRFSKSAYHLKMVLNSGFQSVLQVSRSLDTESSVSYH